MHHDGVLVLDQRNYDDILDDGFTSKHIFYYCGDNVSAEPEYVDEGLARFRYEFPDSSVFHLNMFPLRKDYVRKLMGEVGFQQVKTFADFQESHRVDDPDFFIHVAEKLYKNEERPAKLVVGASYSQAVETARDYYNSNDADRFYGHGVGRRGHPCRPLRKRRGHDIRRQPADGKEDGLDDRPTGTRHPRAGTSARATADRPGTWSRTMAATSDA